MSIITLLIGNMNYYLNPQFAQNLESVQNLQHYIQYNHADTFAWDDLMNVCIFMRFTHDINLFLWLPRIVSEYLPPNCLL